METLVATAEVKQAASKLEHYCHSLPQQLAQLPEKEFSSRPAPDKWSKKEILGHLIDSAANNHQRFVRSQFESVPAIVYDPDKWNESSFYSQMDGKDVIAFWKAYNLFLVNLIRQLPEDRLQCLCNTNELSPVTVGWLIVDYVKHMEHHIRQLLDDPTAEH